jgi:hypothetical protein
VAGTPTTCTATVTDGSSTPVTPTGNISFSSNRMGTFAGNPCTLSGTGDSSTCKVRYTPNRAGQFGLATHTLTATYSGDTQHPVSSAQTTIAVVGRATSTTVTCAPPSLLLGQSTNCTATVTDIDAGAPITPSGKVIFPTSKHDSCTLSDDGGSASCHLAYTPTTIAAAQHAITASYSGDSAHATSRGQTMVQVALRSTTMELSCQKTTLAPGQSTICTATVTDTAPGQVITPTGSVGVGAHRNDIITGSPCTLAAIGPGASCEVTYTPTATGFGRHTLTAAYPGDRYHHASRETITITVTPSAGT